MTVKTLPDKQPVSPQDMVDLTRGLLDRLFSEKINYLEITYKAEGDATISSISITSPYER